MEKSAQRRQWNSSKIGKNNFNSGRKTTFDLERLEPIPDERRQKIE
jgi:hypothetical protein